MDLPFVFDVIPQTVFLVNPEGKVHYCNHKSESMLGIPREKILGVSIKELFAEKKDEIGAFLKDEQCGSWKSFLWQGKFFQARTDPVRDGETLLGFVLMIQDFSEKIEAIKTEGPCLDMEKWLDTFIDASYDGIWICDRNANVIRINKASERINQIKASEVVGKNMRDLVDEGLFSRSVTLEVLKTKAPITLMQQGRGNRKVLVTGNPIFDDQGEILFVLTNDRDLTEMDQLRHELQETQALTKEYISRLAEIEMKGVDLSATIYRSEKMQGILQTVQRVAPLGTTSLLRGESGGGKGLVSKLIHKLSEVSSGPFIRVDCAGIPETLLESELFGYERGAFTGARTEGKAGFFELADQGTLFLDEIGEISLNAQSKLLRFLEEHEIIRVGGTKPKVIKTRVVAATNQNIEEMVATKRFRRDLFYRLHVVPIHIPPLRERPEDILPLAFHFLRQFNQTHGKKKTLSPEVIDALCSYDFPGNVREMMNLMERLVVSTEEDRIERNDLPVHLTEISSGAFPISLMPSKLSLKEALARYERLFLQGAVKRYVSQNRVAEALGVDRATISRKLKRYGIVQ